MKKKFITKIILSGAALAVSAATLASTTYAWYVQNTQVTANGISGAVKDNGASSIYISRDYTLASPLDAHWLPEVKFVPDNRINAITHNANREDIYLDVQKNANEVYNGGLDPITLETASTFVNVNGSQGEDVYFEVAEPATNPQAAGYYQVNAETGGYSLTTDTSPAVNKKYYTKNEFVGKAAARVIEFNLYVQANVKTTIRPYLIIKNTTEVSNATSQTAYEPVAKVSGQVNQGDSFWIDAVQALRMQVEVNKAVIAADPEDNEWEAVTTENKTSNGIYDVLSVAKKGYEVSTGYSSYVPVSSIYSITKDVTVQEGKTYYTRSDAEPYTYTPVASPVNGDIASYYETVSNIIKESELAPAYKLSEDTSVKVGKKYFTRTGSDPSYTYTLVESYPEAANPHTLEYYEFDTANMGANKYYKDLTGRETIGGTYAERVTPILADKINTTELVADTAYKFTFRIWLEGTDAACFDSCINQTFDIAINFDVENPAQA